MSPSVVKINQASSYNEHLIDFLKSVNGQICASCFTYPEYLSALCTRSPPQKMSILFALLANGHFLGHPVLKSYLDKMDGRRKKHPCSWWRLIQLLLCSTQICIQCLRYHPWWRGDEMEDACCDVSIWYRAGLAEAEF